MTDGWIGSRIGRTKRCAVEGVLAPPVPDRLEHGLGSGFLEPRPAQVVLVRREHRLLDGFSGSVGLMLFQSVQLVEALV